LDFIEKPKTDILNTLPSEINLENMNKLISKTSIKNSESDDYLRAVKFIKATKYQNSSTASAKTFKI